MQTGPEYSVLVLLTSGSIQEVVERQAQQELGLAFRPTWVKTASGKPFLLEAPHWYFSISHAGTVAGVAFARTPVGLDLEPADRPVYPVLARRFTPAEQAFIQAGDSQRLLQVWTQKEAYLKWRGGGIGEGLNQFNVLAPENLGVDFWPLPAAAGPSNAEGGELLGWVCVARGTASGLKVTWV
ncbi:MAG: 4'-phosphopantetheinyl transferase superfamily protein [Bifidobacteriaceae bacterium]|jgi:hypothetical protein|nr:4'-phosphopantetheinyl transferase superfamily protein [Bifidobacteriaceae bacterium]